MVNNKKMHGNSGVEKTEEHKALISKNVRAAMSRPEMKLRMLWGRIAEACARLAKQNY